MKRLNKEDAFRQELSQEELETVSAGARDFITKGCAATVESGSDCWGTDGGCSSMNVEYENRPIGNPCTVCGAKQVYQAFGKVTNSYEEYYICRNCGKKYSYADETLLPTCTIFSELPRD